MNKYEVQLLNRFTGYVSTFLIEGSKFTRVNPDGTLSKTESGELTFDYYTPGELMDRLNCEKVQCIGLDILGIEQFINYSL